MFPTWSAFQDVSKQGSKEAAAEMKEITQQEEAEEKAWISSIHLTAAKGQGPWDLDSLRFSCGAPPSGRRSRLAGGSHGEGRGHAAGSLDSYAEGGPES